MTDLYSQLLKAIEQANTESAGHEVYGDNSLAAKACQTISEEWAKGLLEWAAKKDFRLYGGKGWHNSITSDYLTTDELIQLYSQTLQK